jgi:hypothetical protein
MYELTKEQRFKETEDVITRGKQLRILTESLPPMFGKAGMVMQQRFQIFVAVKLNEYPWEVEAWLDL